MFESLQFLPEKEGYSTGTDKVDDEGGACIMTVHAEVVDAIENDIQEDEQQFQCGKLNGSLLVAKVGERYALEGIDSHTSEHASDIFGMVMILEQVGNRLQEYQHQYDKNY